MLTEQDIERIEINGGASASDSLKLCADHRALTARVAELKREVQNNYVNRCAIDGTSDSTILVKVSELITELSRMTAERDALKAQVAALTAERNAARQALSDVRQWFEAHDFQPDEQFSDSNTVAALTKQE